MKFDLFYVKNKTVYKTLVTTEISELYPKYKESRCPYKISY
jgi:hypothetical protein